VRVLTWLSGLSRDVLPIKFTPEDEQRFRRALRRNLVYARTGIFVALAVGFGLAPVYHDALFHPVPAVESLLTLIEAGLVLPVMLAAALVSALRAPRLVTQAVQSAAVLTALLAVVAFRYLALDGAMQYPPQMVGIVLIAVSVFAGFSWQRIALASAVTAACAIAVEVAKAGPATEPIVQAYTLAIMALIAILGAYNLETLARFTWWESSQLRRIRTELLASERRVRLLSVTDDLTGHYNRRGFKQLVEQSLLLARTHRRPCALCFVDVDGLKQINERYGHDGGDLALVTVAEALRLVSRDADIVARMGGDEFLVFAVDCRDPGVVQRRIHDQVEASNQAGTLPFRLSVSLGAIEVDPAQEAALEAIVAQADARMYAAKRERPTGS
jgi:diguanylate cyclase (GGDEF)-like protein